MIFKFKVKPFKHQNECFDHIKDLDYFALFWEMGTGKTKMAIDWLRYKCYKKERMLKTLIICPNIATDNWVDELGIHSFSKDQAIILRGSKEKRVQQLSDTSHLIKIINFEGVLSIDKELLVYPHELIIIDESQRIKNYTIKTTRIILALKSTYRLILSGTPILNSPIDVFSQYLFLDKGKTFGSNFFAFRNEYFIDKNAAFKAKRTYFPNYQVKEELLPIIKNKIHLIADVRKKKECLDLPTKVYKTYKLEMDAEMHKAYREMEKELITFFQDNPDQAMIASNAVTKYMRLAQISSGYMSIDETKKEIRFKNNHKLHALLEVVEEIAPEHKIVIWAVFRNNIEMLKDALIQYNPAVLYGGTSDKYTERLKFDLDPTCRIMIANPQTAKTAINMVIADYAMYYSQNFSAENRWQSEDRCHRAGSEVHEKISYIDFIYKGTIDEIIVASLKNKEELATMLLKIKEQVEVDVYGK